MWRALREEEQVREDGHVRRIIYLQLETVVNLFPFLSPSLFGSNDVDLRSLGGGATKTGAGLNEKEATVGWSKIKVSQTST